MPKPKGTVAYFETDPVNPTSTLTVEFDASFARAHDGDTGGLKYYWDFGDGTPRRRQDGVPHVLVAEWADVKLVVAKGDVQHVGHVPAGGRGRQPVGRGTLDSGLRDVLRRPSGRR